MSTGLSIYFTDRLNKSGANAGAIAASVDGITTWGDWNMVNRMISVLGNISGFSEVMGAINTTVKTINTHWQKINQVLGGTEPTEEKTSIQKTFNTPHGFYDRMKNSIVIKQPNNTNITFEQAFTQFKWTSTSETVWTEIIGKLDYTPWVHALMDKVIHEWKALIDMRWQAKDQIDTIFEQIQSFIGSTWWLLGEAGSEVLKGIGLKGVADFVCLLFWYGSVDRMEKKYREKQLNKEFTTDEKKALDYTMAYVHKYLTSPNYLPATHDDSNSFLNITGLKNIIDTNNSTKDAKQINLTAFPTSPDLIVDSFIEWFKEGGVYPDPIILQNIPELSQYIKSKTDKDGQQIFVVDVDDENKKDKLGKKLEDPEIIKKIIAYIVWSYQDPVFLAKFSETKEWETAKNPADFIWLLFSTCLAPTVAANAWKSNALNRSKIGLWVTVGWLIGLWAQKATELAKSTAETIKKQITDKEVELKTAELELKTAEVAKTDTTVIKQKIQDIQAAVATLKAQLPQVETPAVETTATPVAATPTVATTPAVGKKVTPAAIEKKENDWDIDIPRLKESIAKQESGYWPYRYEADNDSSSATGKYQFLWSTRSKQIWEITGEKSIEEYKHSPQAQEQFMDHVIKNIYLPQAKQYQITYPKRRLPELITLIHFKGIKGALTWLKEGKDNTQANNAPIDTYLEGFNRLYYT